MMGLRRREIVAIALVIAGTIGIVAGVATWSALHRPARIELIARAPERGNWSPQTLHVKKGRPVVLSIRNVDFVTHGFYLPEYDLRVTEIKPGERKELTFTPDRAGSFTFFCSVWCSDYHMHMRGTLVVE
jgi:cytochrome c oxidase subunit 2